MNKRIIAILFSAMIIGSFSCLASHPDQANQVSQITGVAPNKVAKMAEAMEKMKSARAYAHSKQITEAMKLAGEITTQNGFDYEDERHGKLTLVGNNVIAGDYVGASQITNEMHSESPLLDDFVAYINAIADFSVNHDSAALLDYVEGYNSRNKNVIPPKVHDLNYLGRMVRLYEMTGEIDKALELVGEYFSYYLPKNGFKEKPSGIFKKKQKGLKLLKQTLLRDKEEDKNTYAQELINTTDYFGFV